MAYKLCEVADQHAQGNRRLRTGVNWLPTLVFWLLSLAPTIISRSDVGYLSRDLFHRLLLPLNLNSLPSISFYLLFITCISI